MVTVETFTGSVYEIDGFRVRRVQSTHQLRRDGEWVDLLAAPHVEVGQGMVFMLEPLGMGDVTVRRTSQVTKIRSTE